MGCFSLLEIKDKIQTALTNSILDYIWIWNGVSVPLNRFSFQAKSFPVPCWDEKQGLLKFYVKKNKIIKKKSGEPHALPVKSLVVRNLIFLIWAKSLWLRFPQPREHLWTHGYWNVTEIPISTYFWYEFCPGAEKSW